MHGAESAPVKAAGVCTCFALIHRLMGGQTLRWNSVVKLPEQGLGSCGTILEWCIAGMGSHIFPTIGGGDQAEMESNVVDGTRDAWFQLNRVARKSRVACTKGTIAIGDNPDTPSIRRDQHVVTCLS